MYFRAAAITAGAQQGVMNRNTSLLRATCGSMEDVYLSWWLLEQQIHPWHANSLNGKAGLESELAQRFKLYVKLNCSLNLHFSIQL